MIKESLCTQTLVIAIFLTAIAISQAYAATRNNGTALIESCAACHGTDTNRIEGFQKLLGEDHYKDLIEMKYRSRPESIMDWVARTYTDQQLKEISEYFGSYGRTDSH